MKRILLALAACLTFCGPVLAQDTGKDASQFPDVRDTSFVAGNGERTLRLSIDIPAPASDVWQAFATADGWKSWAVATAYVDFREGGQIETSYKPGQPQGDRNNIRNQIIAIVPGQALVFRNVQAPSDFQDPELFGRVVTTIRLEPIDAAHTRVTISGAGYADGDGFDLLYKRFAWGNSYSLVELRDHFAGVATPAETPTPVLPQ